MHLFEHLFMNSNLFKPLLDAGGKIILIYLFFAGIPMVYWQRMA